MSWRVCSSCRSAIGFGGTYWECSVSTCTRPRTGLFFCSVGCWEAHLPEMRHREAWAVEKRAPSQAEWARRESEEADDEAVRASERGPAVVHRQSAPATDGAFRRIVTPPAPAAVTAPVLTPAPEEADEILIVVSKLKKYVKARSGMNTSDGVMAVLSEHLRKLCDLAIRKAGEDGRKTIMDRDVQAILR